MSYVFVLDQALQDRFTYFQVYLNTQRVLQAKRQNTLFVHAL